MRDVGIGRVLVASLHEAIADLLPARLGFYEHWLSPEGLRDGTIGVAPLSAVLSFLRQEGDAYDRIMTRAGEHAAAWTVESMTALERGTIASLPAWLRARVLLRMGARLVHRSYERSHARARVRGGVGRLDLHDSIFCTVREPVGQPLCRFYAAAVTQLLAAFGLRATARVTACRGTAASEPVCVLTVPLRDSDAPAVEEPAA
jgi:hypothetical protein